MTKSQPAEAQACERGLLWSSLGGEQSLFVDRSDFLIVDENVPPVWQLQASLNEEKEPGISEEPGLQGGVGHTQTHLFLFPPRQASGPGVSSLDFHGSGPVRPIAYSPGRTEES